MIAHGGVDAGLFRGAIYESGALSAFPWDTPTSNSSNLIFDGVAATLGCSNSSDKLACIRDVPFTTFYDAFNPANNGSQPNVQATIDGDLIAENPVKALAEGKYVKVPTMIGHNMDEGALFTAVPSADNDTALIALLNSNSSKVSLTVVSYPYLSSHLDNLLELYPNIPSEGVPYGQFDNQTIPNAGSQWRRAASIIGDLAVIAPVRWSAQIFNKTQPVYKFVFNGTYASGFPAFFGATHGLEIAFIFNDPTLLNTTAEHNLAHVVSRTWISFVSELDPNHHGVAGLPHWDVYSNGPDGVYFDLQQDLPITLKSDDFRKEGIALINQVKSELNMV